MPPDAPGPPLYDARVRHVTLHSPALGVPRSLYVYVPPGLGPHERAPSLYLLRGHEREWVNPQEDGGRGGNVLDAYERERAAGRVGPLVLVFPGATGADGRVHTLLANMRAPELAGDAGIGSGRFEDFFFEDLVPFVDAHFPTLADGRRRAVAGFSIGGAVAARLAASRPGSFAAAGAYDGTFLYAADRGRRVRSRDAVLRNPAFDAALGLPRDPAAAAAFAPACVVLRTPARELRRVRWLVAYGPEHLEPWQSNYYRGEHFVACLRARGVPNELPAGAFPGGPHTWRTADAFVAAILPLLDAALRA